MQESYYEIHGVGLRVVTDGPGMAAAVDRLLRHFRRPANTGPAMLEIVCRAVSHRSEIPVTVSPSAEVLFDRNGKTVGDLLREEWQCTLYRDREQLIADFHDQGLLRWDNRRGRMEAYLVEPEALHPDILGSFFHFGLAELLRAQGLYTIHATALEKGGRAVLIPGSSGRGKTTCCISLLRAGYRCLSDDHPLLRENGAGLEILTFPEKIDVTENSIEFFPELKEAKGRLTQGVQKRNFLPEEIYPHALTESGKPALLLFPLVVDAPESRVEPLPKNRALEEIMRQGLLVLDKEVAGRQFVTLARLAEQTPCYRLYFGEDVLALPQLVDRLLGMREEDAACRPAPAPSPGTAPHGGRDADPVRQATARRG
jgi:hypothetical protein